MPLFCWSGFLLVGRNALSIEPVHIGFKRALFLMDRGAFFV